MEASWHYVQNTFESATRRSNKKALILFEDTMAKLKSEGQINPNVQAIADYFEPHYSSYQNLFAQKQGSNGLYEGRTLGFEILIEQLNERLRTWEGQVHSHYPEDSIEDRTIFPNRRNPFLKGPYDLRISALSTLAQQLSNYTVLATTASLVSSFYNQIEGARLLQQQHEGNSARYASLLEDQRLRTCDELYGVLARLMFEFRNNRERVTTFFDLTLLK